MKTIAPAICFVLLLAACSKSAEEPVVSPPSATSPAAPSPSKQTAPESTSEPPKDILEAGIKSVFESFILKKVQWMEIKGKMKSYSIENQFGKKLEDEQWMIYEVSATMEAEGLSGPFEKELTAMVGFVKRGQKWYSQEIQL